jgi:hypothetical protein
LSDPNIKTPTAQDLYNYTFDPSRKVPKPEDLYILPVEYVRTLVDLAPKITGSGAWWSLSGDLGENMLDVHVRPTEVEIVTDTPGLSKVVDALSAYGPTPIELKERRLERDAETDGNRYPLFVRSSFTQFTEKGIRVIIHGEYQMKVGEWEWGDSFFFDPVYVNLAGVQIPIMPLRLRTEIYMMLCWDDRVKLITGAYARSHGQLYQVMDGP